MTNANTKRSPKRTPVDAAVAALCNHGIDPHTIVIDLVDNRVFTVAKPLATLPAKKAGKSDWTQAIGNGL